ncbi:unnamed protein product [Diatraea saccharalis]|uniref:Peptidase M14 domain-containing protein n=1 Tax=Diatraea saccharalis TaxID=40085 RepID=A0A9P0C1N7_9NEOP|nr:unnamed protein product [Diatraea saccharalis]
MLAPEHRISALDQLDSKGIMHYLHIADVAKTLEKQDEEMQMWRQTKSRNGKMVPFEDYPRYAEVDEYLEKIAADYSDIVTLVNAGSSYENRPIKYLKLSSQITLHKSKPIYFMDAMIHAREWVTTPVALYTIHRLVENLRDQDRDLLHDIDWIILPLVNPDGYEYSHTDFRLWRRTRSIGSALNSTCIGVDANRNFDVEFNTVGVGLPCSDTFPGSEPFSEPETAIIRDVMAEHDGRIQLYMNIHSHGNWILYGFGNRTLPSNAVHLHHVAASMGAAMDALKLPAAGFYKVGNSALILYQTSGSAQDYGQAVGIPFSYTLELPGYGWAFQVPPQFIEHINAETWEGIAVTARLARSYYRQRDNFLRGSSIATDVRS